MPNDCEILVSIKVIRQALQLSGKSDVVAVQMRDVLTASSQVSGKVILRSTDLSGIENRYNKPWISISKLANNFLRVVGRAVVADDDFEVEARLLVDDALQALPDIGALVICDDTHRHFRRVGNLIHGRELATVAMYALILARTAEEAAAPAVKAALPTNRMSMNWFTLDPEGGKRTSAR